LFLLAELVVGHSPERQDFRGRPLAEHVAYAEGLRSFGFYGCLDWKIVAWAPSPG
jgi:hypothetical protein